MEVRRGRRALVAPANHFLGKVRRRSQAALCTAERFERASDTIKELLPHTAQLCKNARPLDSPRAKESRRCTGNPGTGIRQERSRRRRRPVQQQGRPESSEVLVAPSGGAEVEVGGERLGLAPCELGHGLLRRALRGARGAEEQGRGGSARGGLGRRRRRRARGGASRCWCGGGGSARRRRAALDGRCARGCARLDRLDGSRLSCARGGDEGGRGRGSGRRRRGRDDGALVKLGQGELECVVAVVEERVELVGGRDGRRRDGLAERRSGRGSDGRGGGGGGFARSRGRIGCARLGRGEAEGGLCGSGGAGRRAAERGGRGRGRRSGRRLVGRWGRAQRLTCIGLVRVETRREDKVRE